MKEKKPSSLARILGYAGGHKNLTLLGCILSALSAVLGLAPYLCVWLVARSILAAWPSLDGGGDLGRFGWMAVWFAVGSILLYFAALMSTHIAAFRTARNIRRAAMAHVLKLPLGFFTGNQSGRLRKLIDDNAGLTEDLLAHKLPDLAATAVTPIAAIVVLFLFDWRMGLLCLLTMVLALLSMCLMMGGKNAGFFHRYQKEIERMSGEAVEYVRGIPVVKMFQQTVYSFKAFYAAIQDYSNLASQYAMSCRTGQTCFLTFINGAFALLIPAALLIASGGDVRTALVNLIFYALFAPACGQMINRIMYMSEAVMEADEAIGRLDEILSQQPMEEPKVQKRPASDAVAFDHVTFTYPGADRPALEDVSFSVRPGEVVALVGPSGGGKTTAASLIPGSGMWTAAASPWAARTCGSWTAPPSWGRWPLCSRIPGCSRRVCWKISGLPGRTPPGRRCLPPPMPPSAMTSWKSCPRGWTRWWAPKVSTSPAGSSSALPWPVPF